MENSQNTNGSSSQTNYSDPSRIPSTPYPTPQWVTYGNSPLTSSFGPLPASPASAPNPGSAYGAFPGSSAYGAFSGSQSHTSQAEHHVTDFRAFTETAPAIDPLHLAPKPVSVAQPPPTQLTEVQRLAHQFQLRHGDPGDGTSHSALRGQWADDDIGGRAAAQRAWQAALVGSRRAYDPNFREPDLNDEIFDEVAMGGTRGGTGRGRGRGRGRGQGSWRKLLKGTEHESVGAGSKNSRGRGGARGRGHRRKPVDPGPEFKTFMAKANRAKLDGDIDTALDYARQAVGANPEIYQAHSLVSELLKERGELELSVHTLWVGAQSARTVEAWSLTAERILELAGDSPTWARLKSAVDCYGEALKLSTFFKHDNNLEYEVRARKFELYKELNDSKGARIDCRNILKRWPKKTYYLNEYARLCAAWGDVSELIKAKEAYDHAFDLYRDEEEFGDTEENDPTGHWSHLNIYLEVVQDLDAPWEGIATGKRLSRWFLGRKEESFWDKFKDDDREFDDSNERRNLVGEFQMGKASRDMNKYGLGLPIEIRVRLGLLRMKCGVHCYEEALKHFRPLLTYVDWVMSYYELFQQVAACLRAAGFMKEAAEYYDCLRKLGDEDDDREERLDDTAWIQLATCYRALERTQDAIACYELVRLRKGDGYVKACAKLAKLYEDSGETDKARFLCNELICLNRRDLLMDADVKMVPPSSKVPPPSILPRSNFVKPPPLMVRPKPSVPLRELRPNGMPNVLPAGQGSFADFQLGGPVSAPVTLPPVRDVPEKPQSETLKKRKRVSRKKKGMLQTIVGDVEDPEPAQEEEPRVKRPKLMKPMKPRVPTRKELQYREIQDAETRALAHYEIIKTNWSALKDGKDEEAVERWVEAANSMLDDFSSMRVFFPERDRNLKLKVGTDPGTPFKKESRRSNVGVPGSFLTIPFSEWHHVFVDLAIVYANSGEQDRCYRVLKDVMFAANVFYQDEDLHWTSYGTGLYCGFAFNDSEYLIGLARQIITKNYFRGGMAFQLLAAVNRFAYGNNWFSAGPTQKFVLRMVKQFDYMVMSEEVRHRIDWSIQSSSLADRAKKFAHEEHELDAGIVLMYGHMVAVANHSHSALPYYYRALALQPENICVNLSIATMWVQNSMKRQTENRQFGITQGLSFLYRYYDLRVASGKASHRQEAEYNVARMWHQLGLTHLALPAYEKVLGLSEAMRKERLEGCEEPLEFDGEDFAMEAAYALQNMYALAGNQEAAKKVTEEWLVI